MERQDDPQLWDLLGHSKTLEPSPFFARTVLRAIREETPSSSGISSWFQWRRLVPSLSAVAALVIAVFTYQTLHNHRPVRTGEKIAAAEVAAVEVVEVEAADLDVLSGDDESDDASLL